ncbi:histone acetyltransferase [Nematocida sp. AWRm80]|nr:histone acetyltransferase [Nematocida sp. AWRm80]
MFTIPKEAEQKIQRNKALKNMLKTKEIELKIVSMLDKDYIASAMILLELRAIFQKQLPKMPKEYVTRLVFDIKHKSMALVHKKEKKVLGGICFRVFYEDSFAEIVFCAVNSDFQIKGYGEFMMSLLKKTIKEEFQKESKKRKEGPYVLPIYLLTYADNYAIGYFKKQGFTKSITFTNWKGKIKDYEGGTLMQTKLVPGVDYLNIYTMLIKRRDTLIKVLKKTRPEMYQQYTLPERVKEYKDIPGLLEAGFTPDTIDSIKGQSGIKDLLLYLCIEMQNHNTSWPFLEPVNPKDVHDYYTIIKHPMDLQTIQNKIEADRYSTLDDLTVDVQLIVNNCQAYNGSTSHYTKCAKSLNEMYQTKLKLCKEAYKRRQLYHTL